MASVLAPLLRSFFFNDTAPTEIYALSLHDALPISMERASARLRRERPQRPRTLSSPPISTASTHCNATHLLSSDGRLSYDACAMQHKLSGVCAGHAGREGGCHLSRKAPLVSAARLN